MKNKLSIISIPFLLFASVVWAATYYHDGADFNTEVTCYEYSGADWVECTPYYHTGADWVEMPASGGGATYLLEESFETTPGTDDPDWSGTADPDYTTTVLAGSESLQVTNTGDESYTNALASDQTYVSVYFLVQTGTVGVNNDPVLMLLDSADGEVGSLIFRTADTLRLFHGTETATTVGTVGASTTYHVWVDFNVGATGASYSVAFSTDGTKPSSGNNFASGTTTGSGGANSVRKILLGGSSADNIFDNIKVDDVEIGSNP